MELKTFIRETLLQILDGVSEAQKHVKSGTIIPTYASDRSWIEARVSPVQVVDFEIVLKVEESSGLDAKIGVVAGILGAGGAGKHASAQNSETRIKLSVPVAFHYDPECLFNKANASRAVP